MKISKFLAAMLTVFSLTSCLSGGNDDQYYEASLYDCVNYVENTVSGDVNVTSGIKYNILINITKSTLNLTIDGLQLTQGGGTITAKLENLPCTYDNSGNIVVTVPSITSGSTTFSNFTFKMRQRYMTNTYIPVFDINYNVNGNYYVRTFQASTYYFGTTSVVVNDTPNATPTTTDKTFYCVTFDKTTIGEGNNINANLYIYSAKFADKMPQMDMMVFNIPAKLGRDGYNLSAETLKVYTGNKANPVEQPDYAITDFSATGTITNGLNIHFKSASRFILDAELGYAFTQGVLDEM